MLDTEATPTKLSQTRNVSVTILPNFSLTFSLNFPLNFLSKAVGAFLYSGSRRARLLSVVKSRSHAIEMVFVLIATGHAGSLARSFMLSCFFFKTLGLRSGPISGH